MSGYGLPILTSTHVRLKKSEVERAIQCGAQNINTYIPTRNGRANLGPLDTAHGYMRDLDEIAQLCTRHDVGLHVSLEHASRLWQHDRSTMTQLYREIAQVEGVCRLGYADTTGEEKPNDIPNILGTIWDALPQGAELPVRLHLHNDGRNADTNALVALQYGAENGRHVAIDVSRYAERSRLPDVGTIFKAQGSTLSPRYDISHLSTYWDHIRTGDQWGLLGDEQGDKTANMHVAGPHLAGVLNQGLEAYTIEAARSTEPVLVLFTEIGSTVGFAYFLRNHATDLHIEEHEVEDLARQITPLLKNHCHLHGPLHPDDVTGQLDLVRRCLDSVTKS